MRHVGWIALLVVAAATVKGEEQVGTPMAFGLHETAPCMPNNPKSTARPFYFVVGTQPDPSHAGPLWDIPDGQSLKLKAVTCQPTDPAVQGCTLYYQRGTGSEMIWYTATRSEVLPDLLPLLTKKLPCIGAGPKGVSDAVLYGELLPKK